MCNVYESPYKARQPLARYLHGPSTFLDWNAYNIASCLKNGSSLISTSYPMPKTQSQLNENYK